MAAKTQTQHDHLDKRRRDRGQCPGCDQDWADQDAFLASRVPFENAIKQVEGLVSRTKVDESLVVWCPAIIDVPLIGRSRYHTHACALRRRHKGKHLCPECEQEWSK